MPTPARPRTALGVAMTLAAALTFALNGTAAKLLLRGGFDPVQLTTFRATGACLGLLALCAMTPGGVRRLRLRRRELPALLGFGLTGFFLVPMLYFVAISRLPIGIGLLFEFTGPVFIALWVRFGERRPVRARLWLGLVLCLGGLAAVAEVWAGQLRLDLVGIAAALASAVLLAVYYVLGSRSVADRDPISLTCWAFAISAVAGGVVRPWWTLPWAALGREVEGTPMWALAAYLLVLGTIAPYLLVTAALRHLPATSVGIIGTVEPVLASAFAWVLLAEVLVGPQILGGLVVLVGVILAETARAGGPVSGIDPPATSERRAVTADVPPT